MKNIVLASVLGLSLISSAWATETVNIHERVNNAQAPAHQMQSSSTPAAIQGAAPRMAGMDQHEQAIIVHETMNNSSADAHKKMAESHQKMMGTGTVNASRPATSFAAMNEHERAAVAHEFTNNGQSGPHQAMADAHRRMINAG
ncbi:silver-binding protein SilE [Salmonella enterica subsp. enterica serovar Kentucky]|uniref:silver-binding protein SilE n=1 Tax=Salmonella enterica TaxID=28901 RepID=UPI0021C25F63|nr:silver-binding protein SilE [Salmonella enterica]ECO1315295.1 silver-binding protein SilE [Salmonella enterica subsp. enterica serovar Kentucky]EEK7260676.1 silver-binding protein SilE [Salmonella enterica subsp. enterica serovar Kentucky]